MTLFPSMIIPWLIITNEEKYQNLYECPLWSIYHKWRKKSKPPWPSLVGCPRLMNVEENMWKNLNGTSWRTSSWRVLRHQWHQRKSPIFCMAHKDVGKTLVLCLTVLTWSPLAKVLISDWSTWLMSAISCLEKQTTLPLHDHIRNHDCTTSWNLTLRGYRRRKSLKASKTFIQQCMRQLLSSWGGSRKCKCILLVPHCHSCLLQEERNASGHDVMVLHPWSWFHFGTSWNWMMMKSLGSAE